jgi:hypothetical protein
MALAMYRLALIAIVLASTPALAKPKHHTPGVQEWEIERPSEINPSAAAGTLLPFTIGARHERQGILIGGYGGFDQAKRAPVMAGTLDATFIENVTFRAVAMNAGMSDRLTPSVGVLVDIAREEKAGIDFAVGGDYELEGWNRVPSIVTRVAAGSTVGVTRLQANAAFGLGIERGERYGDLRLSGLHPVAQSLYAGLDSRARVDLERDMDEPSGELDWDVQAGPVVTLALGRYAISAQGGVSAWKARTGEQAKVGATGSVGVGAAF